MSRQLLVKQRLPRHLVELYRKYSFTSADENFAFAYSGVAEWATISQRMMSALYDTVQDLARLDGRLAAQEHEFADKMTTCWRLRGFGTLAVEKDADLSCENVEQANALRQFVRARCKTYLGWLDAIGSSAAAQLVQRGQVVLDKGKGAPYWSPSTDKLVTLAYARIAQTCSGYEELENRVRGAGAATMPFCQTSYIRLQAARKPSISWRVVNNSLQAAEPTLKPKVRRIGAQPFAVNHLWAGVGNLLRYGMATIDNYSTGTPGPAALAANRWPYVVAFDLAGYDTTVSLETLTMMRAELLEPVLSWLLFHGVIELREYTLLLECDEATQEMSILLPPSTELTAAELVQARGQTRSGENLTSWKGTEINRARIAAKMAELHLQQGVTAEAYNYGDDTVVMFERSLAVDQWAAASDEHGFKETIAPDATFLMKRLPDGYSYLGRMVSASVNREAQHEPRTPLAAAAAFATRSELLEGHPASGRYKHILELGSESSRWDEALGILATGIPAKQLTWAAAMEALAANQPVSMDAYLQQLAQLQAHSEAADIRLRMVVQQRVMAWADFQRAASDIPVREAERMLAQRSYTLTH